MRRFLSSSPAQSRALPQGALCTDATFKRVLGTRGSSEPILGELIGAWVAARTPRGRVPQTTGGVAVVDATICDPAIFSGAAPRGLGDLVVDVRARDSDQHFIVEVQHRVERLFPHRAILYAAAEIVAQHAAKASAKGPAKAAAKAATDATDALLKATMAAPSDPTAAAARAIAAAAATAATISARGTLETAASSLLLPVHTLAFCDYDFQDSRRIGKGGTHSSLSTASGLWRSDAGFERDPELALHFYGLLPDMPARRRSRQKMGNQALDRELAARLSFVFALLPHAPRLEELTARTPLLLRWASLVAHAEPENLNHVPKSVRSPGVERLLDQLASSAGEVARERAQAEEADDLFLQGRVEGRAEGEAKGRAEGEAKLLLELGITSAAAYRARFDREPSEAVVLELER
jgi:hypothetical protein